MVTTSTLSSQRIGLHCVVIFDKHFISVCIYFYIVTVLNRTKLYKETEQYFGQQTDGTIKFSDKPACLIRLSLSLGLTELLHYFKQELWFCVE